MKAEQINSEQRDLWNGYVNGHKDSIAWHLYEWNDIVSKHYSTEFLPLGAFDGTNLKGVLPLYRVGNSKLISVPYAVAGGMLYDNKEAMETLLNKAIDICKSSGGKSITFKQYKVRIEGDLREDKNYYNRELNISGDLDEIRSHFDKTNRHYIDKGKSLDLSLIHPFEDIESFYRLLLTHHRRKGVPCVSIDWIKDLVELKWYSIAAIEYKGKLTAATMVKRFKDTVSFPFTCLGGSGEVPLTSMYALYWEMIKRLSGEGIRIMHSGRIPESDRTEPYRLGWGGEKHSYYYQYYPYREIATESNRKQGFKRKVFSFCWKRLPLGATKKIGPKIAAKFP